MSEKTEEATPKRQQESREKGDVAKSQDIPSAMTVMGIAVYFLAMGGEILQQLLAMTMYPMTVIELPFSDAYPRVLKVMGKISLDLMLPLLGLVFGLALVSNIGQIGFMVSVKAALPKLENLDPKKWFKKVFSMKNLVEFLKNILKVTVLTIAVWHVLENNLKVLFKIQHGTILDMWSVLGNAINDLLLMAAGVFCAIAALDFAYQKWHHGKEMMMTKDEVKREYKESEGDPQIKGKRKQLHQELLAQNSMDNVRKSKVLVTNPTHFAVALDYEKDRTPLPVILAKGEGLVARRMVAVAKEEKIPIMENVPLARSLFHDGTENAYIPRNLIAPVAEVLRWVQSLQR